MENVIGIGLGPGDWCFLFIFSNLATILERTYFRFRLIQQINRGCPVSSTNYAYAFLD